MLLTLHALTLLLSVLGPRVRAQLPPPNPSLQKLSIDYERTPEAVQQRQQAEAERAEKAQQDQQKKLQMLTNALGSMGKGGGDGESRPRRKTPRPRGADASSSTDAGGADGGGGSGGGSGSGGSFNATGGGMQACGSLPPNVAKNLQKLKDFRAKCRVANTGDNQKFAINDYSCKNGQPMMYLFDTNGTCEKKLPVTFGNGSGAAANSCPKACSTDKSHLTPPGFHLTAPHNGKKYGPNNSLLMVGLEGQGSAGRAILIHGAQSPGTASSWGCTGVGFANLMPVLNYLGNNALVYNAFDSSQLNCGSNAGMRHDPSSCRKDAGAPTVYSGRSGPGATSQ